MPDPQGVHDIEDSLFYRRVQSTEKMREAIDLGLQKQNDLCVFL